MWRILAFLLVIVLLTGCPVNPNRPAKSPYVVGFYEGFNRDDYYWMGFFDGLDTVDGGTIYYVGDQIPVVDDPLYDAGFYDGLWYAYNDGYFVEYDYAFTIGFSEGYDVFFRAEWESLLQNDEHIEWLDGGFSDGYHDGFSEGRIFGAYDYVNNLPFDWLDAMLDYRSGTDLVMGGVYTGDNGPVYLYEWGTDPKELIGAKALRQFIRDSACVQRKGLKSQVKAVPADFVPPPISYRPLVKEAIEFYTYKPTVSERFPNIPLRLQSTWLERVRAYRQTLGTM